MKKLALCGLLLCWLLGLAACRDEKTGGASGKVESGPAGLLVELTQPGSDKLDDMQAMIRARLEAFGVEGVEIRPEGERRIRINQPGSDIRRIDDMRKLLFEIPKLDISPVEPAEDFFAGIKDKLPAEGGFRVGVDEFGDRRFDKMVKVSYLAADDSDALLRFIAKLETPEKMRLAPMLGAAGAMAFLLPDPPPIENCKLFHVRIERDEEGKVQSVVANLAKPFLDDFKDLIERSLHRPLAILVDGQVRALPVVWKRRAFGDIHFLPSSLAEPDQVEREATRLSAALRNLSLMGRLKFISQAADK